MPLHTAYRDALDQVLSWDLGDDACPDALISQARLIAGLPPVDDQGDEID